MSFQQTVEDFTVFEPAIHALAEERHDRVSRIAEQQCTRAIVPGRAFHRYHVSGRVGRELFFQTFDERNRVGKMLAKKIRNVPSGLDGLEAYRTLEGEKERTGKA